MPTVAEKPVKAYAHCRDARCPGYNQQEVDAVREEMSYTFGENGGDGIFVHFVEKSVVEYKFANDHDVPCPACGQPREISGQPRPSYQPLSGFDPMGLLKGPKFDPSMVIPPGEDKTAALEAKLEALQAKLDALLLPSEQKAD